VKTIMITGRTREEVEVQRQKMMEHFPPSSYSTYIGKTMRDGEKWFAIGYRETIMEEEE
jgi:hypothetical protein